jgi:hypothetical protein
MDEKTPLKRYKIQHPIDEYTFPAEAHIHAVRFDEKHMHVELMDQRIISIPLWWIPTLHDASDEDRNKFEINQSRTMIIWNPEKCGSKIQEALKLTPPHGGVLISALRTEWFGMKIQSEIIQ